MACIDSGRWRLRVLWLFCLALGSSIPARAAEISAEAATVDQVVNRVKAALVRIHVVSMNYQDGREMKSQGVGSGVIISEEGQLITNHHVAGHAVRLFCTLADREEVEAELVGTDPLTDISVLRLKPGQARKFPCVPFGDSSKLRVGDPVLALGSPMALSQSVTRGIISNLEMVMPKFWGPMGRLRQDGEDVGMLVRWIAHDAQIYGGNSGGPLVNLRGEIVGINEISLGLSGAIPGNLAHQVADQLMRYGKVRRAWLGCEVQPLLKQAAAARGILVSSVMKDSPAGLAGIQAGDLLVRVGQTPVHARFDEELPEFMGLISELPIGAPVPITVWRDGKEQTFPMTPTEREEARPKQTEFKSWGMTARNLSWLTAREMQRSSREGVLITSVRPGGPVSEAKPRLDGQDVLVRVNDTPVTSVQDLVDLTRQLTAGKTERTAVLATFERKERRYLTVVKLALHDFHDPGLEATKAWLPVEAEVISRDIAAQLGKPELKGFYVTRVYPGGTAEKAGLKTGDFIVAVDEEKLTASAPEHDEELSGLIRQYEPGAVVKITVVRQGQSSTVPVELERSPRLPREMKKYRSEDFEFAARDLAFTDRNDARLKNGESGVLVEEVKSGGWAELGMIYAGDIILEVDGLSVGNVDMLRTAMEQIAFAKTPFVVVKVLRGIYTKFLSLEPQWKL